MSHGQAGAVQQNVRRLMRATSTSAQAQVPQTAQTMHVWIDPRLAPCPCDPMPMRRCLEPQAARRGLWVVIATNAAIALLQGGTFTLPSQLCCSRISPTCGTPPPTPPLAASRRASRSPASARRPRDALAAAGAPHRRIHPTTGQHEQALCF